MRTFDSARVAVPRIRVAALINLAGVVSLAACSEQSPSTPAAPESSAQVAETAASRDADAVLSDMIEFLAGLDAFSAHVFAGYDVLQESGEKIQFLEVRDLTLDRPTRMRVAETSADGGGSMVLFDGAKMTVWDGEHNVYAQADQPGSVDDAILYFVRDLQMRLPLAQLLTTRAQDEFERRVQSVSYVELTQVLGEPAHHLAGRTDAVDFQVWIAAGEQPLPLRIVLTYPDEGRPQYWAQFSDWNLRPTLSDADFAFAAPADAKQIAFAIQVPPFNVPPPAGDVLPQE